MLGKMWRLLAPLAAGLAVAWFSNVAEAQCNDPNGVPFGVLDSIIDQGSVLFGDLDENVCEKIVKEGRSLCKTQVKVQGKCGKKQNSSLFEINAKQCKQLEDSADREECKSEIKEDKQDADEFIDSLIDQGLGTCDEGFADSLLSICLEGVKT